MDKEQYRREEMQQEYLDDLKAEHNKQEFVVDLTFRVIVETHEKDLAIEEAFNILTVSDLNNYLHKEEVK